MVVIVVALVAVFLCCYRKAKCQAETLLVVDPERCHSDTRVGSFFENKKSYKAAAELSSMASDTCDIDEVSDAYKNLHLQFLPTFVLYQQESLPAAESVQLHSSTTGAQRSQTPPFSTVVPSSPTREAHLQASLSTTRNEQSSSSQLVLESRPLQTSSSSVENVPPQITPPTVEDRPPQSSLSAVEDRPPQITPPTVEDRPPQSSLSAVEDRPPQITPPTVEGKPLQTSPSTVKDRPPQTSPSTVHVDDGSPPSAVEDRPPQTSPSTVHVDDGSPPSTVEDRPPQTSPSAVGVVPEQASISIANVMELMENRPLFIVRNTFLHNVIVDLLVVHL